MKLDTIPDAVVATPPAGVVAATLNKQETMLDSMGKFRTQSLGVTG